MENQYNENIRELEGSSLKDYFALIRLNIAPILWISFAALAISVIYALNAVNIYSSKTLVKLKKPSGSILEGSLMPEFSDFGNDRFIANELEILQSYTLREKVVQSLIDTFRAVPDDTLYYLIMTRDEERLEQGYKLRSTYDLIEMLNAAVKIEQKRGLDIVEISVESPSAYEAALISNIYAKKYEQFNLTLNRQQLTVVTNFLEGQRKEKLDELNVSEDRIKDYQEKGGIIELSEQAKALIAQLSTFEAERNAAEIEMNISEQSLNVYKKELDAQDPKLKAYIDNTVLEARRDFLAKSLAEFETRKDFALSNSVVNDEDADEVVKALDKKIKDLNDELEKQVEIYKQSIYASSPEEIKELVKLTFEEEVKFLAAKAKYDGLAGIVSVYEKRFNDLPQRSIQLARLQRELEAYEKLYLLVEEKYQEALIMEQSTSGDVVIIDPARIAKEPSKPNRKLIVIIGLVLGFGLGFGFAFVKNYFDNTVKTPEDIQNKGINVLAWIPSVEGMGEEKGKEFEFIVARKPSSNAAEAFRALRTRVQYSKVDRENFKKILITSSAPREGKTTIAVNLAGSLAQSEKKTLLIDCDLRKPRVHNVFKAARLPGFTDYFLGEAEYEEVFRDSELENLKYVTAGTIPPNPAELLASHKMIEFLNRVDKEFDFIVLDSPPIISVTDSEILSRIVDASILVVSSETTDTELMQKSAELLKHDYGNFIGSVLNNFSYKSGYSSYYKYYHYYYSQQHSKS